MNQKNVIFYQKQHFLISCFFSPFVIQTESLPTEALLSLNFTIRPKYSIILCSVIFHVVGFLELVLMLSSSHVSCHVPVCF